MLTIRDGDGADARLLLSYSPLSGQHRCDVSEIRGIGCCDKAGSCSLGGGKMLAQNMLHSSRALTHIKELDYVES
jgi:hypothetical protein